MSTPLISIIVPVYNTEKYLRQCVDSVLAQPYNNIEVILVNDGSLDGSPAICDEYALKEERVKVIHKENGGLSDARNHGIDAATGDFLMFLDSDDFWTEDISLQLLVDKINRGKGNDFLLYKIANFFQDSGRFVKSELYPIPEDSELDKISKLSILQTHGIFPISACDKLIKRDFILRNKLFFIKGLLAEDTPWFIEVANKANNFAVCNHFCYVYRKDVSTSISASSKSTLHLTESMFKIADQYKQIQSSYSNIVLGYMAYVYTIILAYISIFSVQEQEKFHSYSWLLDYDKNKKVRLAKFVLKLFGQKKSAKIFQFYIKNLRKYKF